MYRNRTIKTILLACCFILIPTSASSSLLNIGVDFNKKDVKETIDHAVNSVDYIFDRVDELFAKILGTTDTQDALATRKTLMTAAELFFQEKMTEVKHIGSTIIECFAYLGATGLSACFAFYPVHQLILEYIQYRNSEGLERQKHADLMKYYAIIAMTPLAISGYTAWKFKRTLANFTPTLPVPSAQ